MAIFLEAPQILATYGLELPVRRLMQRSLSILILWRCIRAVLEKGFITVTPVLLKHGVDARAQDKHRLTPLHWASYW